MSRLVHVGATGKSVHAHARIMASAPRPGQRSPPSGRKTRRTRSRIGRGAGGYPGSAPRESHACVREFRFVVMRVGTGRQSHVVPIHHKSARCAVGHATMYACIARHGTRTCGFCNRPNLPLRFRSWISSLAVKKTRGLTRCPGTYVKNRQGLTHCPGAYVKHPGTYTLPRYTCKKRQGLTHCPGACVKHHRGLTRCLGTYLKGVAWRVTCGMGHVMCGM